jgi:hypothetical protein
MKSIHQTCDCPATTCPVVGPMFSTKQMCNVSRSNCDEMPQHSAALTHSRNTSSHTEIPAMHLISNQLNRENPKNRAPAAMQCTTAILQAGLGSTPAPRTLKIRNTSVTPNSHTILLPPRRNEVTRALMTIVTDWDAPLIHLKLTEFNVAIITLSTAGHTCDNKPCQYIPHPACKYRHTYGSELQRTLYFAQQKERGNICAQLPAVKAYLSINCACPNIHRMH